MMLRILLILLSYKYETFIVESKSILKKERSFIVR